MRKRSEHETLASGGLLLNRTRTCDVHPSRHVRSCNHEVLPYRGRFRHYREPHPKTIYSLSSPLHPPDPMPPTTLTALTASRRTRLTLIRLLTVIGLAPAASQSLGGANVHCVRLRWNSTSHITMTRCRSVRLGIVIDRIECIEDERSGCLAEVRSRRIGSGPS